MAQHAWNMDTAVLTKLSEPGLFLDILRRIHHTPIRVFKNPERAPIAPSVTERVLTTCPPERLFIATVCLRAEHRPYSVHSAQAQGRVLPGASRLPHYLFSIENTHLGEKIDTTKTYNASQSSSRCLCSTSLRFWRINNRALLSSALISICEECDVWSDLESLKSLL